MLPLWLMGDRDSLKEATLNEDQEASQEGRTADCGSAAAAALAGASPWSAFARRAICCSLKAAALIPSAPSPSDAVVLVFRKERGLMERPGWSLEPLPSVKLRS